MLTLVVSHRVLNFMRRIAPEKGNRWTPMRWAEAFYASSGRLLERVLKVDGIEDDPLELLYFYLVEGVDPWVQVNNFQENNSH